MVLSIADVRARARITVGTILGCMIGHMIGGITVGTVYITYIMIGTRWDKQYYDVL